ncbi:hypothetical protein LguiB_006244 [Lonicera macranthoides]
MASISFIIGIVGNVISILMFASPIGTFKRVLKKKSTENYKGIPYITTLLSTSLWTFYGLLKPDGLLIVTVNGAGAALQLVYVILFLIYSPKDTKIKSLKLAGTLNIGFFGAVIIITLLAFHGGVKLTFVGVICAGLTIGMYASPLSAMRTVIKTGSVEYMPFFLSFFQFLNGGVWAAYSVLIKDFFIGVPNAIGFILGSAQLILYTIYKNKSSRKKSEDNDGEEGSAHLIKGTIEMQDIEDEEKGNFNVSLSKGRSLPIPSSQHSFQRVMKTITLNSNEWHSKLACESDHDLENETIKDNHA